MTHVRAARTGMAVALAGSMLALAACGGNGDDGGNDGDGDGDIKIGLVQINQQALFFNEMNAGAEEAAEDEGVDLTIFNANDDASTQNEAIANMVTQGFDALIVVAIDVEGIKPALAEAKDAGMAVIAVDAIVDDPNVDVQVGVDNDEAGRQIGEYVNSWIEENGADSNIGVVGALNSFIQNIRMDSFVETVEAAGGVITQTVDGENRQEAAMAAAENMVTAQDETSIVYATGEPALLGTVAAVRSQNAADRIRVFGWDLTAEAISGIDEGFVEAVVQQDPRAEGVVAVQAAKTLVEGGAVESPIDVPVAIVTSDNVDEFRSIFE
ncbi:substrate-binding domain-containing protein [Phytoactinopolyspora mesophila]|uniref:Substrate-binding domain-containing protein n=1 Tax=Phytoactinopolyspora mesophila TaxID=2650750 RepID=A0A7K3M737_9ACTN|nr:substrate-binding domain-containing protein [Phytoactinopolyspora mesophila]NDL59096.1 substrate-binding domain-containing protein [Phytoactinopolyspora mesophila]